jgi:Protein of unknown function (DUF732)
MPHVKQSSDLCELRHGSVALATPQTTVTHVPRPWITALPRISISTVAALATLLLSTPAAHADDTDDNYLSELDTFGLAPAALHVPSAAREIALGHTICIDLATSSESPNDMVTAMMRDLPNLSRKDLENLVSAAVVNYCINVRLLQWS